MKDSVSSSQDGSHQSSVLQAFFADSYNLLSLSNDKTAAAAAGENAAEWCKSLSLFMPKSSGAAAAAAIFALDAMKTDTADGQTLDAALGAMKGLSLHGIGSVSAKCGWHPVTQGLALGVASRLASSAFSRSTYSKSDQILGRQTLDELATSIFDREAIAADAMMAGGTFLVMRKLPVSITTRSTRTAASLVGGTYGLFSGALSQTLDQQEATGHPQINRVVHGAVWSALRDATAAYVAGGHYVSTSRGLKKTTHESPATKLEVCIPGSAPPFGQSPHSYPEAREEMIKRISEHNLNEPESESLRKSIDTIDQKVKNKDISEKVGVLVHTEVSNLFHPTQGALPPVDRKLLALQMLSQVAEPRLINQGARKSCYPAAHEFVMTSRHPDAVVQLISQVARTGRYSAPHETNIRPVELDSEILHKTHEHKNPFQLQGRSYPSTIFQVCFANLHWHNQTSFRDSQGRACAAEAGSLRLQQVDTDIGKDEHLFMHANGTRHFVADNPYMSRLAGRKVYQQITGEPQLLDCTSINIPDASTLRQRVQEAMLNRQTPVMLIVQASKPPFNNIAAGPHAVCIYDADMQKDIAYVHNPWGRSFHKEGIPFSQLFRSLYRF
jgi:hypothetical protein